MHCPHTTNRLQPERHPGRPKRATHLCQQVVLWVLVQRCDCPPGPKPRIDGADALLPQHAVVWCQDVSGQGWDLLKQLVLRKVQQRLLSRLLLLRTRLPGLHRLSCGLSLVGVCEEAEAERAKGQQA